MHSLSKINTLKNRISRLKQHQSIRDLKAESG